jgi:aryl-alcohol dehydrogenase-like predicted oxidoreductase
VRYRRVGDSGLTVSELALGTWRTYGSRTSDADVRAAILRAHELGVTLFDTANIYQHGGVEELLGSTLRSLPRESYAVCTKVGYPMSARPNDSGLSRNHIVEQCHGSLRRLGLDYIDMYVCHRPDPSTPLEETLRALDDLITQGKLLYAGVSSFAAADLTAAHALAGQLGLHPLICHQPQYSLLAREPEREVLATAQRLGIGTIAWAPLAQGVLTGKYKPGERPAGDTRAASPGYQPFMRRLLTDEALRRVQRLVPIAAAAGVTLAQLALAWVLRREEVSSAVLGVSRPAQLDELLGAAELELSEEVLSSIETALEPLTDGRREPFTDHAPEEGTPRRSR